MASELLNRHLAIALGSEVAKNELLTLVGAAPDDSNLNLVDATMSGDLTFTGSTGTNELILTDNLADALSIKIAAGADLMVFKTTNSSESITLLSATTQKFGAYGVTPVVQPSAYTQTYSTADKTVANPTAATLTVTDGAGTNDGTIGAITDNASTIAAVQELAAQINKLVADNLDLRQAVTAIIDDLQALGWVA